MKGVLTSSTQLSQAVRATLYDNVGILLRQKWASKITGLNVERFPVCCFMP
ncbi:hypothetical protein P5673_029283, partial [Acropora cervicornis]